MSLFDPIEKLINEHGSAEILKTRIELAKEQFEALERKVDDTNRQIGRLESELALAKFKEREATEQLAALRKEHEEEVRIVQCVEFRKGKRTSLMWDAFCPKCRMPVYADGLYALCSGDCGWRGPELTVQLETLVRKANTGGFFESPV